ncbi:MAG: N-formylglutamate amidohydrolase [Solidesulfovibrio sp.]|uniref:N-formylglutamate amidohydrolase n=1 Tax=Solidesulfovibrio sp. TaxID=2910990 RepID=UPI002B1FA602|nr:N-formylglutamate amidohydrolase [Solidesulfovibrio sp.]MEA4857570.1 N-formylglutamate amidohydrolase [Solidesulfovibrio sp.]
MSACLAPLITCEHAGRAVPPEYGPFFRGFEDLLASHRGFDAGALETARRLAAAIGAPVLATDVTRLLVDANRSEGHPGLYSEVTKPLPAKARQAIRDAYHRPHWQAVAAAVARLLEDGETVLHVASHSFVPRLGGVTRRCDVGFLYDPGRAAEKRFCLAWRDALAALAPELVLRRNHPYRGVADGLVTAFRRRFGERYLGVELEVNQRFALAGGAAFERINRLLAATLADVLGRDEVETTAPGPRVA